MYWNTFKVECKTSKWVFGSTLVERYHSGPGHCKVKWPVPLLASGSTLLERYHSEPGHCKVKWPVPLLASGSTLLERYHS